MLYNDDDDDDDDGFVVDAVIYDIVDVVVVVMFQEFQNMRSIFDRVVRPSPHAGRQNQTKKFIWVSLADDLWLLLYNFVYRMGDTTYR